MRKLYIICGHGAGDSGAVGFGYQEAERVRTLGRRIKELGGDNVTLLDTSRNWYADNGVSSLTIPKDAGIAELHMDAATPSARGGHIMVYKGFAADAEDKALAELMRKHFPGRAELIDFTTYYANLRRAASRGTNYRMVENGFITNRQDLDYFNAHIDDLAKGYLAAFGIPVAGSQPKPEPFVHKTKRPTGGEATVGSGDVYRLYNPNNGRHMLTMSQTERISLVKAGWNDEGVAFKVSAGGDRVYRLYNQWTGEHLFTASLAEAQSLWDAQWEFEGVAFMSNGDVVVYRLYNRYTDDHLLTVNFNEMASAAAAGWQQDGVAFRVAAA